ncbi:CAP domain-containing protein [Streptomyces thermodiastaticus]
MATHRKNRQHRRVAIAVLAMAGVGIPSAAMAWVDGPDGGTSAKHRAAAHMWADDARTRDGSGGAAPAADTSAAPAATTTPAPPEDDAIAQVVDLVNAERAKAGCSPVTLEARLTRAAQAHSEDMAAHQNMSHTGSDGSSPGDRITRAGYDWRAYGENVAYGYATPEQVMDGWMNSPGHRANILDCDYQEIGVGHAQPGDYWTQDFAAR